MDVGLERLLVGAQELCQLRRRRVQPLDGSLHRHAVRVDGVRHAVVRRDELGELLLARRERRGEGVELLDDVLEVAAFRRQGLDEIGAVLDQPVEVLAVAVQRARRLLHELRHRLRVQSSQVVLQAADQLVGLGGDRRPGQRDRRTGGQDRPPSVGGE